MLHCIISPVEFHQKRIICGKNLDKDNLDKYYVLLERKFYVD